MDAATKAAIKHGTGDVWFEGMKLERELNEANEHIKRLEEARTATAANSICNLLDYEDTIARIERLENYIKKLEEWGDYMKSHSNNEWWCENWSKAREAKP